MELGYVVNLKRVARLMRQVGIQGLYLGRSRLHGPRPGRDANADLVEPKLRRHDPNARWVADITDPTRRARCTALACSTCSPAGSSAGRSPTPCAPNWSPTPWTQPSCDATRGKGTRRIRRPWPTS